MIQTQNDGGFKFIKTTLIVLYSLSLIGCVLIVGYSIFAMVSISNVHLSSNDAHYQRTQTQIQLAIKNVMLSLVIGVYSLLISIMGLIGIVKEYHYIMIVMTVLGAIGFYATWMVTSWYAAVLGSFSTILSGVYAYMIIQRNKVNSKTDTFDEPPQYYPSNIAGTKA